jgi:RimJ/RimL family protein N-acetyltransferase
MEGNAPRLVGTRVVLRPPQPSDVAARVALGTHPEIEAPFGTSRNEVVPVTPARAEAWLQRLAVNPYGWLIEAGTLVGEIRLDRVDRRERRAALAVGILDPRALGKGLGTEAMALALDYAFRALGLHRVSARVLAHNARAIRAYQKCGFVAEGREREAAFIDGAWHDDLIMGVLDRDFAASGAARLAVC